jgi:hypothetical protein
VVDEIGYGNERDPVPAGKHLQVGDLGHVIC